MSARLSARLAWALCAVALVLLALALVLVLLGSGTPLPRGWSPWRTATPPPASWWIPVPCRPP
jgi:hypothetical protein